MSRHFRVLASLLCVSALVGGCKDKSEPEPTTDRTLEQLRLEVERMNKGGAPSGPPAAPTAPESPHDRLAQLAAGSEDDTPLRLRLVSRKAVPVHDGFEVRAVSLEAMHTVSGTGRLSSLTTDEYFVRLTLETLNKGQVPATQSLEGAVLEDATGQRHPITRDAQNLAGTRQLGFTAPPGEPQALVLLFEVPATALEPGLSLVLPQGGDADARVPLQ